MSSTTTTAAANASLTVETSASVPSQREAPARSVLDELIALKGSTTISVCLPATNHGDTIGAIVGAIAKELVSERRLIDEILVIDGGSSDATRDEAAAAGATVLLANELFADFGAPIGRGDLLWRAVGSAMGDIVVWIDPDLTTFSSDYVVALVEPLMRDADVVLVRGASRRGRGSDAGGVTEAVARPVLALLNPEFSTLREPFGGEYAGRREALRTVPFEPDYGVEIGLLVDLAAQYGASAIREVELEGREHRYRSLADRAQQTRQMLRAALSRAGTASVRGALPLRPAHAEVGGGYEDRR